ncbi:multiple sugar transport system permease protein/raffinose/stachyose/melibiose transport system permease protein [Kribbella aluminosa]|uniref:Multiple sugar transport system permease protein/raffinose/stachyose/melibiose transport system permease protein n=1 Tax=Kribbella aluminosa TaxID=416017 RepID=A0ABS4UJ70_9ACTN|nr:carbohydrate ABC transporter permease [Kribbella aluminosa]MBP2351659.1 multiple sugar transport system permease protein/raffinose/stachyose/melibiose transport system permease protein [Kribbella aluminosa]
MKRLAGRGGLYGLLVVAAVGALFPMVWLLIGSLQTSSELYRGKDLLPAKPQWSNYVTAWTDGDLGTYLPNSAIYTVSAVAGILLVSSMAGYVLARIEFRGKSAVTFGLLAVMIIPAPAAFIAQYKLMVTLGLTNSRIGYVLILISAGIPISTLIMRGFFANLPKDLEEAAAIDGSSALNTFARVILPLARPGLIAVAVIQGLSVWNEYLLALVLFDDDTLMPVQRGLMNFVSAETPVQNILLAATAISVLPVVVFYVFAQRQVVQGISSGAVK